MGRLFRSVPLVLNLHSLFLFGSLNINPHSFVHLFSLLTEPRVVLFSVYGKPESSGAVLVGFELQNNIVSFERKAVPYRV